MSRWRFIRVTIVCDAPAGVAAPERKPVRTGDSDPDAEIPVPLATDPRGRPWVPGRSLAGSLRAHLGPQAPLLLGSEPQEAGSRADQDSGQEDDDRDGGREPSALRVLGTRVRLPGGMEEPETRRSTAIDRCRGAARPSTLRAVTRLPVGTEITAWLRLDEDPELWAVLSEALSSWQPVIGGGLTRGFGRAHVTDIRHGLLDLDDPAHLARWLRSGGPDLADAVATETLDVQPATDDAARTFRWKLAGGLHVGDGRVRAGGAPEVATVMRADGQLLIPGSTWKGLVRSRVEYILSSCGQPCCFDRTCGSCPPCQLFGHTLPPVGSRTGGGRGGEGDGDGDGEDGASGLASVGARGILAFDDSVIEPHTAVVRDRTHVAVDRITGGARDKLLYTDEVVEQGETSLRIRPLASMPPWGWGLVLMALRDIHDGYVGVGRGTTRGYGTLTLTDPAALDPLYGEEGQAARALLTAEPAATGKAAAGKADDRKADGQ